MVAAGARGELIRRLRAAHPSLSKGLVRAQDLLVQITQLPHHLISVATEALNRTVLRCGAINDKLRHVTTGRQIPVELTEHLARLCTRARNPLQQLASGGIKPPGPLASANE